MEQFDSQPHKWAIRSLRVFVHPDFQEEIEGDLLEKYSLLFEDNIINSGCFCC